MNTAIIPAETIEKLPLAVRTNLERLGALFDKKTNTVKSLKAELAMQHPGLSKTKISNMANAELRRQAKDRFDLTMLTLNAARDSGVYLPSHITVTKSGNLTVSVHKLAADKNDLSAELADLKAKLAAYEAAGLKLPSTPQTVDVSSTVS